MLKRTTVAPPVPDFYLAIPDLYPAVPDFYLAIPDLSPRRS